MNNYPPILYDEFETSFSGPGIGPLVDAISLEVRQELGGEYSCDMEYLKDGVLVDEIKIGAFIYVESARGAMRQPFEIARVTKTRSGNIKVVAYHVSYRLSSVIVLPYSGNTLEEAVDGLKDHAVSSEINNFSFVIDRDPDGTKSYFNFEKPQSAKACLVGDTNIVGGRHVLYNGFEVDIGWKDVKRGNILIDFSRLIEDYTETESSEDVVTGIAPYWFSNVQFEAADGTKSTSPMCVTIPDGYMLYDGAEDYVYNRIKAVDVTSLTKLQQKNDKKGLTGELFPTEEEVATAAKEYMKQSSIVDAYKEITIKPSNINYSDEYLTDEVYQVGDSFYIQKLKKKGWDIDSITISATTYDALNKRFKSITCSTVNKTLVNRLYALSKNAGY